MDRDDLMRSLNVARPYVRRLRSVIGLVVIIILAIVLSPRDPDTGSIIFIDPGNISDILRQVSEIGIMALAMTFVILTAGIDLSVGSVLALSASLVALLLTKLPLSEGGPFQVQWERLNIDFAVTLPALGQTGHIAVAIMLTLLATAAVGALNGLVIANLKLQPFIATLAAMIGIRGLARWMTNNANIDIGFGDEVSAVFADATTKPLVIGAFVVLAVIFALVLARTVFGRYVRALGDNSTAALYAGLPTKKIRVWVYMLSGLLAGIAGVIHCAQNRQGSPNAGVSYELEAIAAVVIGGTSLAGGKGSIFGTIVGTLIMGVLTNMLRLNNVDSNVEMMLKAVIIVIAVWVQRTERGKA